MNNILTINSNFCQKPLGLFFNILVSRFVYFLLFPGGSAPITKHLLDYGSDVNHFNKSRVFPLHSACTNGSLDIVKILVEVLIYAVQQFGIM